MRIFPHLRPGFTDAPFASPAGSPPSRHSTPRYPCFALADLIRDSALNLVRYTAVCMPRLALPATSATHTLSHPLLSFSATLSRTYYLPTLHTHVHGNPPISRIASSLVSTPLTLFLSRTETTVRAAYSLLLHPFRFSRLLPCSCRSPFSLDSLLAILSISPSLPFSLFILRQRLYFSVFLFSP